jgi:hypothetical protein
LRDFRTHQPLSDGSLPIVTVDKTAAMTDPQIYRHVQTTPGRQLVFRRRAPTNEKAIPP